MADGPPKLITINHDDHHARYVGRTKDGKQFFLTVSFALATGQHGQREFLALYTFDKKGNFLDAKIDDLEAPLTDGQDFESLRDKRLDELGELSFGRIKISPFAVERFGLTFGLIPDKSEDEWTVELQPGNYMAFCPPWNSGEYDT